MKNNRDASRANSAALGPEPAVPRSVLTPAAVDVLERLDSQPGPVAIADLAAATGLHQNTVREHLDQLVEAGAAVKTKAPSKGRGRPAWLYRAADGSTVAGHLAAGANEYGGLASALAAHIDRTSATPGEDGIAAGLDWGRQLARDTAEAQAEELNAQADAVEATIDLLDRLGFAPRPAALRPAGSAPQPAGSASESASAPSRDVRLTRCPLLAAAHEHPDIVCGVHLGLVRGALEVYGEPSADSDLEPFSEPGACRLHLSTEKPSS